MRPSSVRRIILILSIVIAAACTGAALLSGREDSPVVFNEICSGNVSAAEAPDGSWRNYVELYNPTDSDADLTDWYLSDNKKHPKRRGLQGVTVPAHGYSLVWLGKPYEGNQDEDAGTGQTEERTQEEEDFDLSPKGGNLILSDRDGRIRDTVRVPPLSPNTSYSEMNGDWEVTSCTPGAPNEEAQILPRIALTEPELSQPGGFYDAPFALKLSAGFGEEIWYTTDGSDPVPGGTSSEKYRSAIPITDISDTPNRYAAIDDITIPNNYTPAEPVDKSVVIRAVAYDPASGEESRIVTATYFIGYQNRTEYDGIPVISLVSDPVNLFDYDKGIYTVGARREEYLEKGGLEGVDPADVPDHFTVDEDGNVILPDEEDAETPDEGTIYWRYEWTNSQQGGRTSERPVSVSFYDADHTLQFTQDAGVRIAGESTRYALQKSLNLFARDAYDPEAGDSFGYAFFGDSHTHKIRLHRADDDGFCLDAFLMELAADRDVGIQRSIPAAVFLDGEYWGLYYIREQYTKEYFHHYYGTDPDNLWVMKNYAAEIGSAESVHNYDSMVQQMTLADMSDPVQYGAVENNINVNSLIDWYCVNLYVDNEDLTATHNLERWRTEKPEESVEGDAHWNFLLYDMDQSCALSDGGSDPSVNTIASWKAIDDTLYLPGYLSANENFRTQYRKTMMEIADTTFSYERVHEELEEWKTRLEPQAVKTIRRFSGAGNAEEIFEQDCEAIDRFFRERKAYMEQYLQEDPE